LFIVGPDGGELSRASETEPELIKAVFDLSKAEYKEAVEVNNYLHDRRPELYSRLVEKK